MALSPRQRYIFRGHPSSPGVRDFPGVSPLTDTPTSNVNLSVLPQGSDKYTKDGKPGIPRYVPPYPKDYHADSSNLGSTPNGPKQPGILYVGELPTMDPWNVLNARLRQATIEAYQSGGAS